MTGYTINTEALDLALKQVGGAYVKARTKHAPMRGPHEGYAVILEEVDELWDEIKAWQPQAVAVLGVDETSVDRIERWEKYEKNMADMRKEALHVAAMALAFLIEVAPDRP